VQHRSKDERNLLEEVLSQKCKIKIRQADEKEVIRPGTIYFAPPDYHLLIERNGTFSLTSDPKVNYSRPSIDVLFETAAMVYKHRLLAIILTGANQDGAAGMKLVKEFGGTTIAQEPDTAQFPAMPKAAIDTGAIDYVFHLREILQFLYEAGKN
jgi:two-component system, chemotaxis family, protein-glutamate methylesterase/glutaminase